MPQIFLSVSHAAHCGRRPRVSFDKQFCVGFSSHSERERSFLRIGHRRPYSFIFCISSIALILRAIPCCIRLFPTPIQQIFLFSKFFKCSRLSSQIIFSVFRQFFTSVQGSSAISIFSNFFQSLATLASTTKYFTRFGRKGEGHARVSHPIIHFNLLCSAALRFAPLHSNI